MQTHTHRRRDRESDKIDNFDWHSDRNVDTQTNRFKLKEDKLLETNQRSTQIQTQTELWMTTYIDRHIQRRRQF